MAIWGSQSIQFVWFLASVEGVSAGRVFEQLIGKDADNTQTNRAPNPGNPFLSIASATIGETNYQVQVQAGRVDLVMQPAPPQDASQIGFKLLETEIIIDEIIDRISHFTIAWVGVVRLAVVINLFFPVDSQEGANQIFYDMTDAQVRMPDASDLNYSLNRRKKLRSTNFVMNRLMRFGTAMFQEFMIEFAPGIGMPGVPVPISRSTYGASLSIDLNTVIEGRIIAERDQITIFEEIKDELKRLADNPSPSLLLE